MSTVAKILNKWNSLSLIVRILTGLAIGIVLGLYSPVGIVDQCPG